jgi:hypothetical protein
MNPMALQMTGQLGFGPPLDINGGGNSTVFGNGTIFSTPTTFPTITSSGGSGNNVQHYFDTVATLVSQFLGSRGRYQTSQVLAGGNGPTSVPINYGNQPAYQNPYAQMTPAQLAAYQRGLNPNGVAESAFSGISDFIGKNPVPVLLGAIGIYLLFREPPRRR